MPTILASDIIGKAAILLQDTTNVRWPQAELLGWLNDGQREIVVARPDQTAKYATISMVAGTRQSLPTDGSELLRVTRNMGTSGTVPGTAVRKVPHDLLDSQLPGWHSSAPAATIKHYTYEPRAPRSFYVYPPSDGTSQLEILYACPPTAIATVGGLITIDDIYANALLDYVAFRAYSKDLEEAGNSERAALHRKMFVEGLQAKSASDGAVMPKDQVHG
jgi:hypothetical protein